VGPDSSPRHQMAPGRRGFAVPVLLAPELRTGADEPLLTVKEVAARLQLSTATVYKLVDRGELACVRVANSIRVRAGVWAAYLAPCTLVVYQAPAGAFRAAPHGHSVMRPSPTQNPAVSIQFH